MEKFFKLGDENYNLLESCAAVSYGNNINKIQADKLGIIETEKINSTATKQKYTYLFIFTVPLSYFFIMLSTLIQNIENKELLDSHTVHNEAIRLGINSDFFGKLVSGIDIDMIHPSLISKEKIYKEAAKRFFDLKKSNMHSEETAKKLLKLEKLTTDLYEEIIQLGSKKKI